jgi:hypothetical protein
MSPFREIAVLPPQSQNRQSAIGRYRAEAALNGPATDQRPSRDGSASGSGPARKYTVKIELAAWSWAQMTSGSGARKRVLSEEAIILKLKRPN